MKEFVIPYLTNGGGSWAAVTLLNNGPDQQVITIEIRRFHDGRQIKKFSVDLSAWQGEIVSAEDFPEVDDARYTVVVTGPNYLKVSHVYNGPWKIEEVNAT